MKSHQYGNLFAFMGLILVAGLFYLYLEGQKEPEFKKVLGEEALVIRANSSGHYLIKGKINDYPVVFLVDTGATGISIPESVAEALQLPKLEQYESQTANGVIQAHRTKINTLQLGHWEMPADTFLAGILSNGGDEVLLGMTFLKHFKIIQENGKLTLIPN